MNEDKLTSAQVRAGHRRRIKENSERSKPIFRPQAAFSLDDLAQMSHSIRASMGVSQMGQ